MLFGRNKPEGRTVLILDVESGSVGSALARVGQGTLDVLGTYRRRLPVRATRGAEALLGDIERALGDAALAMSELAARLRHQGDDPAHGEVANVAAFMAPPWGRPNLQTGQPDFVPQMTKIVAREVSPYFDLTPRFITLAGAATQTLRAVSPYEDSFLLVIVTHEMTELLLIHNGTVAGHATLPHGINLAVRTLKSHAGLSDRESRDALVKGLYDEALASAAAAYGEEFRGAARELFDAHVPERVWVVSPHGDYFARALSHESLADLFPQGGVVRALGPEHLSGHLAGPASPQDDLLLLVEALFMQYSTE